MRALPMPEEVLMAPLMILALFPLRSKLLR